MPLTVADAIELEELAAGRPEVVAGWSGLDQSVRWVHVTEIPDIAGLLRGGELVLTTGMGFPERASAQRSLARQLAERGISGLVLELGRRFPGPPEGLVAACDEIGLPLVVLWREVAFVSVTERIHSAIVNEQALELQTITDTHQRFLSMSLEGASETEILEELVGLVQGPALLVDRADRILASHVGADGTDDVIERWQQVGPATAGGARTRVVGTGPYWVVADVGARGDVWGRLGAHVAEVPRRYVTAVEQAASSLALNRLAERERVNVERRAHQSLIDQLAAGTGEAAEVVRRSRAFGVDLGAGRLAAVSIGLPPTGVSVGVLGVDSRQRVLDAILAAAHEAGVRPLLGEVREGTVNGVVPLRARDHGGQVFTGLYRTLRHRLAPQPVYLAVGSVVTNLDDLRWALAESQDILAAGRRDGGDGGLLRIDSVRLHGLLRMLANDARVVAFVERELGPLGDDMVLLDTLRALMMAGGNKASAAAALGVSRPALYQRLERIEATLGVSVTEPESTISLFVAVLAHGQMPRGWANASS